MSQVVDVPLVARRPVVLGSQPVQRSKRRTVAHINNTESEGVGINSSGQISHARSRVDLRGPAVCRHGHAILKREERAAYHKRIGSITKTSIGIHRVDGEGLRLNPGGRTAEHTGAAAEREACWKCASRNAVRVWSRATAGNESGAVRQQLRGSGKRRRVDVQRGAHHDETKGVVAFAAILVGGFGSEIIGAGSCGGGAAEHARGGVERHSRWQSTCGHSPRVRRRATACCERLAVTGVLDRRRRQGGRPHRDHRANRGHRRALRAGATVFVRRHQGERVSTRCRGDATDSAAGSCQRKT